jgi:hypothetical protein
MGGIMNPQRVHEPRQQVFPVVTARVLKAFRHEVDGKVRRVENGEHLEMNEPDFDSMRALGRVQPA